MLTALTLLPAAGPGHGLHRAVGGRERRGQPGRPGARRDLHGRTTCSRRCSWCPATTRRTHWPTRPAGLPSTVAAMNATAKSLGALDTTVRNPSGLDAPGQYTSAYDLAVIARTAMARQDFREYVVHGQGPVPRQDAPGRQGAQDLRDLHPGPAAAELPRRDRGQDRLDHQGPRHLRRRGHPRRPDPGGHRDAQRGQRRLARLGRAAHLGLPQRGGGPAGGHAGRGHPGGGGRAGRPGRAVRRARGRGRWPARAPVACRGGRPSRSCCSAASRCSGCGSCSGGEYVGAPPCRRCLSPASRAD